MNSFDEDCRDVSSSNSFSHLANLIAGLFCGDECDIVE